MELRLVALAGSIRKGSFNKLLVKIAADGAIEAGAEVTFVDLRDFPLPLFDQDLESESGLPENAKKLKSIFRTHDGFLLASPEYNSSITAVLKNCIDWASRTETDDEPSLAAFRGKTAVLMSASPGALGGLRGLVTVRSILSSIGVFVLPDQVAVSQAHDAFDEHRALKDHRKHESIQGLGRKLVEVTRKLKS